MANDSVNNYGVLLFDSAWNELGKALEPYARVGSIGQYLYCQDLRFEGRFVVLDFAPEQVKSGENEMRIYIPDHFVKFIASGIKPNKAPIGFI